MGKGFHNKKEISELGRQTATVCQKLCRLGNILTTCLRDKALLPFKQLERQVSKASKRENEREKYR